MTRRRLWVALSTVTVAIACTGMAYTATRTTGGSAPATSLRLAPAASGSGSRKIAPLSAPGFPGVSTSARSTPTGPGPAGKTLRPAAPDPRSTGARPAATATRSPASGAAPGTTSPASGAAAGTGRIRYGRTYTGEGTFYGATGAGACSFEAGSDRMIAAMNHTDYENSQACGAYLAVTGPNGVTIRIKIVDECPECRPGDLDLSAEAFAKLANPSAGRIRISWTLLSPALSGPVAYRYKEGSSQWWCAIQVRNHRNPVRMLEVKVGGTWRSLPRTSYNYFLSANGTGCGSAIRITDLYGQQLTASGIGIRPNVVQQGSGQFGAPQ